MALHIGICHHVHIEDRRRFLSAGRNTLRGEDEEGTKMDDGLKEIVQRPTLLTEAQLSC